MACRNEDTVDMGGGIVITKKAYETKREAGDKTCQTPFKYLGWCREIKDNQPQVESVEDNQPQSESIEDDDTSSIFDIPDPSDPLKRY